MNGGTPKGQAWGFRLSSLSRVSLHICAHHHLMGSVARQLRQSKSADNHSNLLQYVVEYVNKNQPKVHCALSCHLILLTDCLQQAKEFIQDLSSVHQASNGSLRTVYLRHSSSCFAVESALITAEVKKIGGTLSKCAELAPFNRLY